MINSCVAVYDGATDILFFQCYGVSIAFNASDLKAATPVSLDMHSLWDFLKYIK